MGCLFKKINSAKLAKVRFVERLAHYPWAINRHDIDTIIEARK